jgi:outer membrane lipoprotein-sorting protein
VRLWLSRDDHVVRRFELRDAAGQVLKTLALWDVREVKGIPSAHRLEMRDERAGSRTVVELTALSYNDGLGDEEFTQRRLEKGL